MENVGRQKLQPCGAAEGLVAVAKPANTSKAAAAASSSDQCPAVWRPRKLEATYGANCITHVAPGRDERYVDNRHRSIRAFTDESLKWCHVAGISGSSISAECYKRCRKFARGFLFSALAGASFTRWIATSFGAIADNEGLARDLRGFRAQKATQDWKSRWSVVGAFPGHQLSSST